MKKLKRENQRTNVESCLLILEKTNISNHLKKLFPLDQIQNKVDHVVVSEIAVHRDKEIATPIDSFEDFEFILTSDTLNFLSYYQMFFNFLIDDLLQTHTLESVVFSGDAVFDKKHITKLTITELLDHDEVL
jgi:hypothetical protein